MVGLTAAPAVWFRSTPTFWAGGWSHEHSLHLDALASSRLKQAAAPCIPGPSRLSFGAACLPDPVRGKLDLVTVGGANSSWIRF